MLPEIGATELMVIAAVALIVVGPKDLPVLLRKLGQFVSRLRGMANDFRSSFDEMARQSELDELRKEVAAMRAGQLNPADDAGISKTFDEIGAGLDDRSWDPATYEMPTRDPRPGEDYPSPDAPAEPDKPKRARKPKAAAAVEAPVAPAKRQPAAKAAVAKAPARKPTAAQKPATKTGKSKA
jgi:sec-independent protein translocase protein TatB